MGCLGVVGKDGVCGYGISWPRIFEFSQQIRKSGIWGKEVGC